MHQFVCFIIVCLVALPIGFSLFTYILFWYEISWSPYLATLHRMSGGRTRRWIASGLLSSAISALLVVATYPFGYLRRLQVSEPDHSCGLPPVILVHGLYHNAGAWIVFRRRLKASGFKNVYALNYSSWTRTFPDILEDLERMVLEVNRLFPDKPAVLIGHSLGGLLGHACLQRMRDTGGIATLVTMGTPHNGSKLAGLGMGRLAQSLAYHGPLTDEISNRPPVLSVPLFAFFSPVDNMVLPFDALLPAGKHWIEEITAPVSHVAMLYHAGTASRVIARISNDL